MDSYRDAVRTIMDFLCLRDVERLDRACVERYFDGKRADVIVVFGNDLPQVAETGCRAWIEGIGTWLLFCGGVGHSTAILRERMRRDPRYERYSEKGSEAGLFAEIAVHGYGIPRERILLDTTSANSGENARNARRILDKHKISKERLILMQDPLMQRRSYMSLKRAMPDTCRILNFAPFLPDCDEDLNPISGQDGVWNRDRFLELLLGEIRRLRDDERGYGPKGTGFIEHVDIPEQVETAWNILYKSNMASHGRC